MPDEVKTTRVDEAMSLTGRGEVTKVYRVTFMVGDHGPFTVDLPPAEFTPTRVRAEQEKIAATVRQL